MTDWTDIPSSSVDVDSPITEELMTALRDNPKALAERDDTAPHLNTTPLVQIIDVSGSWVVPDGVYRAKVIATGGGQGGDLGGTQGGGGGTTYLARGAADLVRASGGSSGPPGVGTVGDLLLYGGYGQTIYSSILGESLPGGTGGASFWGGGGRASAAGLAPGSGGGGRNGAASNLSGDGGNSGGTAIAWIDVTPGETLTAVIGAGGSGAGNGAKGIIVIEY